MNRFIYLFLFSQLALGQEMGLNKKSQNPLEFDLKLEELNNNSGIKSKNSNKKINNKTGSIEDSFRISDIVPLYFERNKTDYLHLPGDVKLFYFLPNSFSMKPFQRKFLDTQGTVRSATVNHSTPDRSAIRPFNVWSIGHILYPKRPWSWQPYFSPSINYFSWKNPGRIKFIHLIYSLKLVWHMPTGWGSIKAAAGLGPMWLDGEIFGIKEENTIAIMPRTQLAWHRFLYKRLFLQVKFSKHYLWKNVFNENGFRIKSISTTGIYIGYNYSTHY